MPTMTGTATPTHHAFQCVQGLFTSLTELQFAFHFLPTAPDRYRLHELFRGTRRGHWRDRLREQLRQSRAAVKPVLRSIQANRHCRPYLVEETPPAERSMVLHRVDGRMFASATQHVLNVASAILDAIDRKPDALIVFDGPDTTGARESVCLNDLAREVGSLLAELTPETGAELELEFAPVLTVVPRGPGIEYHEAKHELMPPVVLNGPDSPPLVLGKEKALLSAAQYAIIAELVEVNGAGVTENELHHRTGYGDARKTLERLRSDEDWAAVIHFPGKGRKGVGYRIARPVFRHSPT